MIKLTVPGLTELRERFALMAAGELEAMLLAEAEGLAHEVQRTYRELAPRASGQFAQSIAATALALPGGFALEVKTSEGDVALWLREGTGVYGPGGSPIEPQQADVLHFQWQGQEWFVRSVQGMRPNPWQEQAARDAEVEAIAMAHEVGRRIVHRLAGSG